MNNFLIITSLFLFSSFGIAQDYSDPVSEGEIVVEKPTDLSQNYRDRRGRYGILFSVNYEKFTPNNYVSIFQNKNFEQLSGDGEMPLVSGELGAKFNFVMGSISASASYGQSIFSNESQDVYNMQADITKLNLGFAFDNLTTEPWVVPYGQVGIHQITWEEESYDSSNNLISQSVKTPWTMNYKAGLMLQLNWLENSIDPNTHTNGLTSSGLQNTFLDIFYQGYAETEVVTQNQYGTKAIDFKSNNYGVGLKLEF